MFSSCQIFAVNGDNDKDLEKAIQLALDLSEDEINSFKIDEDGLHLSWTDDIKDYTNYPFKPTTKVIVEHYKNYLSKIEDIEKLIGEEPDIDGSIHLGWKVFHPLWYGEYKVNDYTLYDIIVIKPDWIIYGK